MRGKVVNGADLSFESQASNLRYFDTFGHGTHTAGIIAGRANRAVSGCVNDATNVLGKVPDARVVSVKVADAHGATDVSQRLVGRPPGMARSAPSVWKGPGLPGPFAIPARAPL